MQKPFSKRHKKKRVISDRTQTRQDALPNMLPANSVLDLVFWVFDPFGWKNEG